MINTKTGAGALLARAGVSAALALAAVGGFATAGNAATTTTSTTPVITPSSATGPSAGTNFLTLNLPSTSTKKFTSGSVGVQFQNAASTTAACATAPLTDGAGVAKTVTSNTTPTNLRFVSNVKVIVKVPVLTGGVSGPSWLICAYNQTAGASDVIPTTATVLARGTYTVATLPTVTAISPASGPTLGGQTVTFTGTDFPTTVAAATPLTVTVGGVSFTSITPVSATTFTAVTPAMPAGAKVILVTTVGGTAATTNTSYTYQNGIVISPTSTTSGASGLPVDLDVQGVGFSGLTFSSTTGTSGGQIDANPHVFLTQGQYDNTNFAAGTVSKAKPQAGECINVLVISDSELICTIDPRKSVSDDGSGAMAWVPGTPLSVGSYTVGVFSNANATALTYSTVVSSGSTFTVAPF